MSKRPLLIIILAAGRGTRMKSALPKVLHAIGGLSMVGHVIKVATAAGAASTAVVVGPDMDNVRDEVARLDPEAEVFVQLGQNGTGDAVLAARTAIEGHRGDILVLFADTPLLGAATVERMQQAVSDGAQVAALGFHAADPTGYGRLLTQGNGNLIAIREEKDATETEREVDFCNSGLMGFRGEHLFTLLNEVGNTNAQSEYYLTDVVEIARTRGLKVTALSCSETEVFGINSRAQLAYAERQFQARRRADVMANGATLIDPDSVFFSHDTQVGRDVVIEPNVFLGPGVVIEDNAIVKANCHFQGIDRKSQAGVRICKGAEVGPFARLRPGVTIGPDASVGNFVEVKNATFQAGAKASHLTYVGDANVGAGANIGAGTITCNYDGFVKSQTEIGAGAFIGSNTALVAPIKVGDNAYVGAGSVISGKDVEAGALSVTRASRRDLAGWTEKYREKQLRKKT